MGKQAVHYVSDAKPESDLDVNVVLEAISGCYPGSSCWRCNKRKEMVTKERSSLAPHRQKRATKHVSGAT